MYFSIIIPVYNRPAEVLELLESLTRQTYTHFEILIVEDGSTETCQHIVAQYQERLTLRYYFKENSGQGFSRNFGFEKAKGDFFILFDSDCIIPDDYFSIVHARLAQGHLDIYGGPDRAHPDFNVLQKAISYSMTSIFTTGGIRGRKSHVGVFHPRSFNMGLARKVYEKVGGYVITRKGEDIIWSITAINNGFQTGLITEAFVYHKRRTNLVAFFRQLHFFGTARINISRFYPDELKLVHALPAFFVLGLLLYLVQWFISPTLFFAGTILLLLYVIVLCLDATIKTQSIAVGLLAVVTSFTQLTAYGLGFIQEYIKLKIS